MKCRKSKCSLKSLPPGQKSNKKKQRAQLTHVTEIKPNNIEIKELNKSKSMQFGLPVGTAVCYGKLICFLIRGKKKFQQKMH